MPLAEVFLLSHFNYVPQKRNRTLMESKHLLQAEGHTPKLLGTQPQRSSKEQGISVLSDFNFCPSPT